MDYKLKYLKYKKKYLALKNSKLKGQGLDLEIDFKGCIRKVFCCS